MRKFREIDFQSADDLWEALSPTRNLGIEVPHKLIYRGQGNADWKLIPAALRPEHLERNVFKMFERHLLSESAVQDELFSLESFVKHCDKTGIKIPNDSQHFRSQYIGTNSPGNIPYLFEPSKWPNAQLLDLMAQAQHHGVPTRLLDWTSLPYTACYFAASSSVANFKNWSENSKIAIWVIDSSKISVDDMIYIFKSPGSTSPNLAAQYGLFTVHPHNGKKGQPYETYGLEEIITSREEPILIKLTIPSYEAVRLLGLCNISGFSAADIYPSSDGAGIAVGDERNILAARHHYKTLGITISFNQRKKTN